MAATAIADLAHAPVELLLAAIQERQPRMNSLFNSPLVLQDPRNFANRALEDGAIEVEMPIISPVTGGYTLQNPGTPPVIDKITSKRQKAPVMYREKAWGRDAFAAAQSGIDPFAYIVDRILNLRLDMAEDAIINQLIGLFKSSDFAALKLATGVNEAPVGSPGSNVYFDADAFHDMTGIFGVKEDDMVGGVITMHSKMRTYLKKQDELDTNKPSAGGLEFLSYKGLRVIVDDRLVRAGSTSGGVYPVTILAPGTVVFNIATQGTDGTTSSSLAYDSDVPNLTKALYDRVVGISHINGTIWTPELAQGGSIADDIERGGPTDAQMATQGVWKTAFANVKETRVARGEFNV
jgi:hypothetical protein